MPIVQVAPVTRQGMKLLISLFGMSQTGKTKSALRLMAGIEPDPRKRGLLDTEGGERGRMYMDEIPGGYMYGALTPPFTPERYIEALGDFVSAGVTTLAVDSVSHAWFAAGGVLDMVEQATERNDLAKWAKPKRRLGKMTNNLLSCGLHLLLCSRGKQPLIEGVGENGRKAYIPGPVVPIQEKSLKFDMTVMAKMLGDGRFTVDYDEGGKCPGALRPIFAGHEVMDEEMGRRLIAWIGGQDLVSPELRRLALDARDVAARGVEAYRTFWSGMTKEQRAHLQPQHENLKSIAAAADAEAARVKAEAEEASTEDDLDKPFGAKPALEGGVQHTGEVASKTGFGTNDEPDPLDLSNIAELRAEVEKYSTAVLLKCVPGENGKSGYPRYETALELLSEAGREEIRTYAAQRLSETRTGG